MGNFAGVLPYNPCGGNCSNAKIPPLGLKEIIGRNYVN